ncbi:hypothetical protein ACFUIV_14060 [Streptomyces anulatus]|uniref:hypothetical protein n=1 Tax=Streptomyces anulatus TaxID=1892 RepID=UPI0036391473
MPLARRSGESNVLWTVFGPTNVALHALSVEMTAGDAVEGLRMADEIDVSSLPSRERQFTFGLEVAHCYDLRRDDAAVLVHLLDLEELAPEDLERSPLGRQLVIDLMHRARPTYRRRSPASPNASTWSEPGARSPPGPWDSPVSQTGFSRRSCRRVLDLDTIQHDIDHALTRRVELPRRSVIDAGTDALAHHLRRLMSYNYGPQSEGSTGNRMRTLCDVAERNLAAPVRPTPKTNHRVAYVYWNTLATLTAAFRDLYLAHRPTEPGQRT